LKVLVTGGAGFLGQHLVAALQERGDDVRVVDQPSLNAPALEARGVEFCVSDICDRESLTRPMQGVDAVIHLAAMSSVWAPMEPYHAVNVTGTENVCRAALAEGVGRLIHISSWTVYGMGTKEPVSEEAPLAPLNEPYSVTKAIGDRLVQRMIREDGLPAVIIRPDTIFGPGDKVHIGRMSDRLRAGRTIIVGSGRNAMPFVFVEDIVQGLLLALDRPEAIGQAYNIANDQPLTQEQVLRAIAEDIGAAPPRVRIPYSALYAAAFLGEQAVRLTRSQRKPPVTRLGVAIFGAENRHAIDKARRELGYSPAVPVREGLRRATEWYRGDYSSPQPTVAVAATG
jgi:nucleoside-diphosphate-sugar epimerase